MGGLGSNRESAVSLKIFDLFQVAKRSTRPEALFVSKHNPVSTKFPSTDPDFVRKKRMKEDDDVLSENPLVASTSANEQGSSKASITPVPSEFEGCSGSLTTDSSVNGKEFSLVYGWRW